MRSNRGRTLSRTGCTPPEVGPRFGRSRAPASPTGGGGAIRIASARRTSSSCADSSQAVRVGRTGRFGDVAPIRPSLYTRLCQSSCGVRIVRWSSLLRSTDTAASRRPLQFQSIAPSSDPARIWWFGQYQAVRYSGTAGKGRRFRGVSRRSRWAHARPLAQTAPGCSTP